MLYQRVPQLLEVLGLAHGDGRYGRMLKNLARVQLLFVSDWARLATVATAKPLECQTRGVTPLTAEQRRDLLEIGDDQHDRASTIVTSQVPVDHWHEHIGKPSTS